MINSPVGRSCLRRLFPLPGWYAAVYRCHCPLHWRMRHSPGEFRTWLSNLHLLLNEALSDFPQSEHRHGILADNENRKCQSKMQHSLTSFFWKFTYNIISAKDNKQHWAACTIRLKANVCRYCKIRVNDPVSWNSAFLSIVGKGHFASSLTLLLPFYACALAYANYKLRSSW